ncbi:MAG: hypothetical protein IJ849_08440 [Selenomonadaceae bacterium]|nr:hypothetical protein [Selenomonadaceae bacterium]
MCKIISTRKTPSVVFLEVDDGEFWGVKKLSVRNFDFAKSFHNSEFLGEVSRWTTDRDFNASATATTFVDPMVNYAT